MQKYVQKVQEKFIFVKKKQFSADYIECPRDILSERTSDQSGSHLVCFSSGCCLDFFQANMSASTACKIMPAMCLTPVSVAAMVLWNNELIL